MKILWFSPYSALWDWKYQEFLIQKHLKINNYDLRSISCSNVLIKNCNAINAHHVDFDKNKFKSKMICKRCISNKKFINKKLDTIDYDLNKFINKEDEKKTKLILKKINKQNILNYEYKTLPVGKISMFEIILKFKKNNLNLNNQEFYKIKNNLENCINLIWAFEKINKFFKPDIVITYNGSYAINNLFLKFFQHKGSTPFFITGSTNNSERANNVHLFKESYFNTMKNIKSKWKHLRKIPANLNDTKRVFNHVKTIFFSSATHTFSPSIKNNYINIRKFFKINKNQKIILVAMSSYDEVLSANLLYTNQPLGGIFKNQLEWIDNIVNHFKLKKNIFVIFRPHPREFLQGNFENEHAKILKKIFLNLPNNMCANYPKDNISIYNIGMETSLLLNAWSTAGEDLGMLGIPTITIGKDFTNYPTDIDYYSNNKKKYFEKIDKILKKDDWSFERIRNFYRFKSIMFNKSTISLKKYMINSYLIMRSIKAIDKLTLYLGLPSVIKHFMKNVKDLKNDKELKIVSKVVNKKLFSPIDIKINDYKNHVKLEKESEYLKKILKNVKKLLFSEKRSKLTHLYKKINSIYLK